MKIQILGSDRLHDLAEFLHSEGAGHLTKHQWLEKFRIFWELNPFFKPNEHCRGWVIIDDLDQIKGFLGSIPVQYCQQGKEIQCFWATSWYVALSSRAMSLGLYRKFTEQEGILFNTTPTPPVERIIANRFKFKKLNQCWLSNDYYIPINSLGFTSFLKALIPAEILGKVIAYVVGRFIFFIISIFYSLDKSTVKSEISLIEMAQVPNQLNDWWLTFKERHDFLLVRDKKTVTWLCFSESLELNRKFIAIYKRSNLLGFMILKVIEKERYSAIELVDIAITETYEGIYSQIYDQLRRLVNRFDTRYAYLRIFVADSDAKSELKKIPFFRFAGRSRFYLSDPRNLIHRSQKFFSPIDGDRCLFM